jgi:16S rRNA A1518/A1519 N6-dimethyltransferase RsmA/KsgA/DIM1 with predicted DNA glycosylase/AP lyase activity
MYRIEIGQGTLAFTKQMLRVFNFVELEELDPTIAEA